MSNISIRKLVSKYSLTESETIVLSYILENLDTVLDLGVRKVAQDCYCSTSVIIHLAKKMKLKGFVDMVYHFKHQFSIANEDSELSNFFEKNISKVYELKEIIEANKKEVIYILGNGYSKIISTYFQERLVKLGYFTFINDPLEYLATPHTSNPLVIFISESGETKYLLKQLEKCKENNIRVISITSNSESTLSVNSFFSFSLPSHLYVQSINKEINCFFSNSIMLIDLLYILLK